MAGQLLLENKGIRTEGWFIPPFHLYEGELVLLNLKNPIYGTTVQGFFVDIVTGKTIHPSVAAYHPLTFVPHFRQSWFLQRFNPMSIATYIRKNISSASEYAEKIYEHLDVCRHEYHLRPSASMATLPGGLRRLLTLCAALGRHRYIAFDMRGVGPESVNIILSMVQQHVDRGGAALLIDQYDELRNDCSRYVEVEWDVAAATPPSPR